jgi:hypothetical protein
VLINWSKTPEGLPEEADIIFLKNGTNEDLPEGVEMPELVYPMSRGVARLAIGANGGVLCHSELYTTSDGYRLELQEGWTKPKHQLEE